MPGKECSNCAQPATVGSRCFRHYVSDLSRRRRLFRYKWFRHWFNKFVGMLQGRYLAIRAGVPAPPAEPWAKRVWNYDPRPLWASHKIGIGSRTYVALMSLIETVDKRARRDKDANDNCSEEDR